MNSSQAVALLFTMSLFAYPAGAHAQAGGQQDPATPGQASPSQPTISTQTQTPDDYGDYTDNQFIVNGAIGGAFGGDADDGSFAFDGAFDYLHRGAFGFEFLGSFTPDLDTAAINQLPAAGDTQVNAYMFNAIGAVPLGLDANWLPYISGGVGAITLRNDFNVTGGVNGDSNIALLDENQFGGNIGVGVMGFVNQIGFRADVRYFSGLGNDDDVSDASFDGVNEGELNGMFGNINYWRSTVGVAFRW